MAAKALKICILGTAYPYKGGIAAFNERLAISLMDLGHKVDIITFTLQYPSILYPGKSQYNEGPEPARLNITRMLNSINPISWIKTGRKIRNGNYDIIISKFWLPVIGLSLGWALRSGNKGRKATIIANIDNIIPHEKRIGDKFFTRYFINAVDKVVTMSRKVQSQTETLFPKLDVLYHPHPIYDSYGLGVDKSEAASALDLDVNSRYILFFGFIRKYKGLDLLLNAFAKAKEKLPDVKLIIAGEFYVDSKEYLDLITEKNLQEDVIVRADFIPDDMVKYYFGISDLVAQTYHTATQSGISQIAIHFGKPLLSTDVGGLPETIIEGTNGIIVNVNVDEIANAMIRFFNNPDDFFNRKKALELKKIYSWESFANKLMTLHKHNSGTK